MTVSPSSNKRLVKNTIFLYTRTLILLVIGIFTSRITLEALGIDNYGTVNVVGGFVSMFSLVSAGLTAACQRFITFELGSNSGKVNDVFNTSIHIHLGLCLIILLLAETFGVYFVNNKLDIPTGIRPYVQWVYQCSIFSFLLSIINIPYNALIIAYERFNVFAIISLVEGVLKLGVVLLLLYLPGNKLVIYALLTLSASIIIRASYQIYTRINFTKDVKIHRKIDKEIGKRMFGFAGWSFIGNSAVIFSNQGVNVILNIFCGVTLNAARGLAAMVESVVTGFVNNFTTALNPQITKSYASNDNESLSRLVNLGMRMTFFLMLILALPLMFCAPALLQIWFGKYPPFTPIFVRLSLIVSVLTAIGNPFLTVILATGRIKIYQIVVGGLTFLNFPLSYIFLYLGYSPVSVYIIAIIISCSAFFIRLLFVRSKTNLKIWTFGKILILNFIPISVISCLLVHQLYSHYSIANIYQLVIFLSLSVAMIGILILICGLNKSEKHQIINNIQHHFHKN